MKIVMIITGLGVGGAEFSLLNIVSKLDKRFNTHVISLTDLGAIGVKLAERGISVEAMGMSNSLFSVLMTFIKVVRRLKELRPDVVHTWMYHADCVGGAAAKLARVPGIAWSLHNFNLNPGMLKRSTKYVVKICAAISWFVPTKIISCSQASIKVHKKIGYDSEKFVLIPNGIDLSRFKPDQSARSSVRAELGLPCDTPLIGLIGRFDVQKNHLGFFKAAGIVHQKCPSLHFLLAGDGIEAANNVIRDAMLAADVQNVTHLLGVRDDIPRLMSALDVLVSSSDGEAFPLVLGEAMACGVPCVVTNVGDCAFIVGNTGVVVEPGNMEDLAEAIQNVALRPDEERKDLGHRTRMRVKENFDMSDVVERYNKLYHELSGCSV